MIGKFASSQWWKNDQILHIVYIIDLEMYVISGLSLWKVLPVGCRAFGDVVNNWAAELKHDREGRELLGFAEDKIGTGEMSRDIFFLAQICLGRDSGAITRDWDIRH